MFTHRISLIVDPKDAITFLEKTKEKVGHPTLNYTQVSIGTSQVVFIHLNVAIAPYPMNSVSK